MSGKSEENSGRKLTNPLLPLVPPAARRMFEEMVQETVEGNSLEMELRQDQVEGWVMNSCIVHTEHYCEENEYITLFGRIELDILKNFSSSWDQCSPELSVCVLADVGPKCFEISSQLAQIQSGLDTKCCPFYEFISNV